MSTDNQNPKADSGSVFKAIDLLADWCKWAILVQSALIAAIGTFVKAEHVSGMTACSKAALQATIVSFVVSVVAASWLLMTLPAIASRWKAATAHTDDIFHVRTYEGKSGPKVYVVNWILTGCFAIGLVAFVIFVCSRL